MLQSLEMLGWGYVQPHVLMDEAGEEVELQQTDPKQLRQKLERALAASHEQAATEAVLRRYHVR